MFNESRMRVLGKCLFGVVYSVLFAEVFIQLFAPVAVFPRYVTATPYGVRVNESNRKYWHTSPDVRIQIRTNSKGIRADEEIAYEPLPGVKRILVLGDSFAMGYEATLEGMFTTQMANLLKSDGINVQVVNLAVSGHSNAEELIVFCEEGRKYRPDLVLLCWHSSDLNENIRSGLYDLNGERLVRKSDTYLPGVEIQRRLFQIPGYEWVSSHSQLYSWIREMAAIKVVKPALLCLQELRRTRNLGNESDFDRSDGFAKALTERLLWQIQETVIDSGAKLIILDIPSLNSQLQAVSHFPSDSTLETGLLVVSPIDQFRNYSGSELFHTRSHRHFTPLACQIVGELLAKEIRERGLLASDHKSLSSSGGDLNNVVLGERRR